MDLHNGITEGATGGILITSIFETCTRWHQKHKMNKKKCQIRNKTILHTWKTEAMEVSLIFLKLAQNEPNATKKSQFRKDQQFHVPD